MWWKPIAIIVAVSVGGWVLNTWLRIKHGYPLDGPWGQALHPVKDRESTERIKLLTQENAQLRAEIGSVKDRLETIERIVTDKPSNLAREIDALAGLRNIGKRGWSLSTDSARPSADLFQRPHPRTILRKNQRRPGKQDRLADECQVARRRFCPRWQSEIYSFNAALHVKHLPMKSQGSKIETEFQHFY